jgi:uncharacterized repeat protein (TIGR03803 family)
LGKRNSLYKNIFYLNPKILNMKKISTLLFLLTFSFSLSPFTSLCQNQTELWGLTTQGGVPSGVGVMFSYDITSSTYTKKIDFSAITYGSYPYSSLVQASNGKFYGMTRDGGANSLGTIFEYDPATNTYTRILDFAGTTNGSYPYGSLIQASNGKLYGMTYMGGTSDFGVLFEYDLTTSTYTKKVDFIGTNGKYPFGCSLVQANNGKLYGMTTYGGTSSLGVLFEFDPSTSVYTKKIDFTGTANGSNPRGSLVKTASGKLYGMTSQGGTNSIGVIFVYNPTTSSYTRLLNFAGTSNGSTPYGSLIQASSGKLYGMTSLGGSNSLGILFEFDTTTNTLSKKLDFAATANGSNPYGSLMQSANSKLYGVTFQGGSSTLGTLFEYNISTSTFTKKMDFTNLTGANPNYSQLIETCVQPKFTASIADTSICVGENTNFITAAMGNGLTFQWQVDDGSGFSNLVNSSIYSHVTDDTLHITGAILGMNNYQYRCVVTSTCPVKSIQSDTVVLTVNNITSSSINVTACDSYTAPDAVVYTTSGIKTAVIPNAAGCDSTITINLTIKHSTSSSISATACDSYTAPDGAVYTTSGIKTAVIPNAAVCDSTITINLTIKYSTISSTNVSACTEYTAPDGAVYTSSGTETAIIPNTAGCDSTITINLTINTVDVSVTITDPVITAIATANSYQWLDCDNAYAPIGGASQQSYTATANGNYAVIVTQGLCSDTSACVQIITVGIASENLPGIVLHPDPSNGQFTLELDESAKVEIYNALGSLIYIASLEKGKHNLSLNLANGFYLLKATNDKASRSFRLVIQK